MLIINSTFATFLILTRFVYTLVRMKEHGYENLNHTAASSFVADGNKLF